MIAERAPPAWLLADRGGGGHCWRTHNLYGSAVAGHPAGGRRPGQWRRRRWRALATSGLRVACLRCWDLFSSPSVVGLRPYKLQLCSARVLPCACCLLLAHAKAICFQLALPHSNSRALLAALSRPKLFNIACACNDIDFSGLPQRSLNCYLLADLTDGLGRTCLQGVCALCPVPHICAAPGGGGRRVPAGCRMVLSVRALYTHGSHGQGLESGWSWSGRRPGEEGLAKGP